MISFLRHSGCQAHGTCRQSVSSLGSAVDSHLLKSRSSLPLPTATPQPMTTTTSAALLPSLPSHLVLPPPLSCAPLHRPSVSSWLMVQVGAWKLLEGQESSLFIYRGGLLSTPLPPPSTETPPSLVGVFVSCFGKVSSLGCPFFLPRTPD